MLRLPRLARSVARSMTVAALACIPVTLAAQIRGQPPVRGTRSTGWWLSGGAAAATIGDISDGKSNTLWKFGSDPLWIFRGTLEKVLDDASTLGIAAGYGDVDVMVSQLGTPIDATPEEDTPSACIVGCQARTQVVTLMGQFRSGGGNATGFSTLFAAQGGVTAFRNLRELSSGQTIGDGAMRTDISGTLGAGFAYGLSKGTIIELVQDFGIGFHSKEDLPAGLSRTWRSRATRAALRFQFGGR